MKQDYISIIWKYHWCCEGSVLYEPYTSTTEDSKSLFEIRKENIARNYLELQKKKMLPRLITYPEPPHFNGIGEGLKEFKEWSEGILYNSEFRMQYRTFIEDQLFSAVRNMKDHRKAYSKKNIHFYRQLWTNYIDVWQKVDLAKESLENLIIYRQLWFTTWDRQRREDEIRSEYDKEASREKKRQEKYTWEDSYRDAGGGDEWSDPSEFWS